MSASALGWLADRHGIDAAHLNAALSLKGDGREPGDDCWLRAEPVHLRADRDTLVMADASVFAVAADEAAQLATAINAHFSPRLQFEPIAPERWYARVEDAGDLRWTSLQEARGRAIRDCLPQGDTAMRWNALANELQMLLHDHPVNIAREARGQLPVNSLWLWGAGRMNLPAKRPFVQLQAREPLYRGIALAAGGTATEPVATAQRWLDSAPDQGQVLIVLDELGAAAAFQDAEAWMAHASRLERDWFAPLLAALRDGHIGMLTLVLPGASADDNARQGLEAEVVRGDLRRFWRRPRPLATHLAPESP